MRCAWHSFCLPKRALIHNTWVAQLLPKWTETMLGSSHVQPPTLQPPTLPQLPMPGSNWLLGESEKGSMQGASLSLRRVIFSSGVKEKDDSGNMSVWGLVTQVREPLMCSCLHATRDMRHNACPQQVRSSPAAEAPQQYCRIRLQASVRLRALTD